MENDGRSFFRVISNQVRFGCGFRTVEGRKQYFAWHGYPNRKGIFTDRQRIPAGNTG